MSRRATDPDVRRRRPPPRAAAARARPVPRGAGAPRARARRRPALGAPGAARCCSPRHGAHLPVEPRRLGLGQLLLRGGRPGGHAVAEGLAVRRPRRAGPDHRRQAAGLAVGDGALRADLRVLDVVDARSRRRSWVSACVALLYALARRWSGPRTALAAAALLASMPAAALMFTFNNPDAMLVLCMVAAAYTTVRAVDAAGTRAGTWWLVGAGALVGLGFLTKQLQVALVVPALALVYLVVAPTTLRRRIGDLVCGRSRDRGVGRLVRRCSSSSGPRRRAPTSAGRRTTRCSSSRWATTASGASSAARATVAAVDGAGRERRGPGGAAVPVAPRPERLRAVRVERLRAARPAASPVGARRGRRRPGRPRRLRSRGRGLRRLAEPVAHAHLRVRGERLVAAAGGDRRAGRRAVVRPHGTRAPTGRAPCCCSAAAGCSSTRSCSPR